ncbi:MAG TPA: TolC family protein [Candidatus Acidoferrales bacterium]|nr:TolC family protein [Candidatus Acidoferrales bacterium]
MLFRSFVAGIILTAGASAQLTSFPKPDYFRETFQKAKTTVELKDPVKLPDFVHEGKLELSLKDYLALVMANNTDIALQMLSVETPKNAITRAFATWDPLATASFNSQRSITPASDALQGAATVVTLNQPAAFTYQQTLPTGTSYTAQFNAQKNTTNSGFSTFNPALNSTLSIRFSQPLLKNRGTYVNKLNLMSAKSRLRVSEYGLRANLLNMINAAENAYWDVVSARENLKVAEGGEQVAEEFLKLSQKQLELGALSPLDIFNPERQLATAKLAVSQAQFALLQKEDALRRQIGADLDPKIRKMPLVLTEAADMPDSAPLDTEAEVDKALNMRPDLKSAVQSLDVDDLAIRSAKNNLLPNLALTGLYQTQGRGGVFYQRTNVFDPNGAPSTIITSVPGGFTDALDQMFAFGYPVYSFGVNLTLPIKSHQASADMADAVVQKKRDALTVRTTQQQIRLDILNAVTNLEGSKEQLKLARIARDLAQKNYEAEKKKYELGTEQNQFVLQAQNDLVTAESNVVINLINVRRSVLTVLTKTGELLDERGIVVQ